MDFLVKVHVNIYPTEDPEIIKNALSKIFPEITFNVSETEIVGESNDYHSLDKLRNKIHEQRIIDSARLSIISNSNDEIIKLIITKQHSILGTIHFCDSDTEPPLGCIVIEIFTEKRDRFIDWFTPKTQDGRIIEEIDFE